MELHEQTLSAAQNTLHSILDWMPVCAIVCDCDGLIQHINASSIQFFKAQHANVFHGDKQQLCYHSPDPARLKELLHKATKSNRSIVAQTFFRRFDKSISGVEVRICQIPTLAGSILILFYDHKPQSEIYIKELSRIYDLKTQSLKPYLNKAGKEILHEITCNSTANDLLSIKRSNHADLTNLGEERLQTISSHFQSLSEKELILCGYLSMQMSIEQISGITGSTTNSIRVLLHRMLKKTNFSKSKDFVETLRRITIE